MKNYIDAWDLPEKTQEELRSYSPVVKKATDEEFLNYLNKQVIWSAEENEYLFGGEILLNREVRKINGRTLNFGGAKFTKIFDLPDEVKIPIKIGNERSRSSIAKSIVFNAIKEIGAEAIANECDLEYKDGCFYTKGYTSSSSDGMRRATYNNGSHLSYEGIAERLYPGKINEILSMTRKIIIIKREDIK